VFANIQRRLVFGTKQTTDGQAVNGCQVSVRPMSVMFLAVDSVQMALALPLACDGSTGHSHVSIKKSDDCQPDCLARRNPRMPRSVIRLVGARRRLIRNRPRGM
jgi:hypothetical protein